MSIFPIIDNATQVRAIIQGLKEFSETCKDGLIIFNYKYSSLASIIEHIILQFGMADTFPDPNDSSLSEQIRQQYLIRRECRGLICDAKTGNVLSRGYHKFFNVNELDECSEENIDLEREGYVLLEKLDGYFATALLTSNQNEESESVLFASKTGIGNKNAKAVQQFVKRNEHTYRYEAFCLEWIKKGYTPIFEFCSMNKKIVVSYDTTRLVLTALRDRRTGEYVKYEDMVLACQASSIPVVHAWRLKSTNFQDMIQEIKHVKDSEGCVLRFDSGAMYKIKTLFYTNANKGNSDLLAQEWQVWALILHQKIDDVKANAIKRALRNRIEQFERKLYSALQRTADRIEDHVKLLTNELDHLETKEEQSNDDGDDDDQNKKKQKNRSNGILGALLAEKQIPEIERPIYQAIFNGKDAMQAVISHIASQCTGSGKLNSVKYMADNIHFYH